MKKILRRLISYTLCACLCIPAVFARGEGENQLQVGLAYGSGALTAANLQNNTGYGTGYRLGYFGEDLEFQELGYTDHDVDAITMLRTSEIYLSGSTYSAARPSGNYKTIGCYHVVLDTFRDYEDALELAEEYPNGFVAWIDGEYQAREGAYATADEAYDAAAELGGEVEGTSAYAVNVVETGSAQILFQFDGGEDLALGVMPDVTGEDDVRTWFKGYKYRGGFRYERIGGGDLTVVNVVDLETYIKGVIPYEMSNNWPSEALEAQAVCARSYAYNNIIQNKHRSGHFDLCNTTDCQVYHGLGSNSSSYQANDRTDRAVERTAGMYALYNGKPIEAFYSSSHGGASERVDNVWNSSFSKYPYLCGVVDPYEQLVDRINSKSHWTVSFTKAELSRRLQEKGYGVGTSVESLELTYSEFGNVIQVQVNFENGKRNTFTPKMNWGVRSLFGVSSLHFTVNGAGASSGKPSRPSGTGVAVNENQNLDLDKPVYVLGGNGKPARIDPDGVYTISGSGKVETLETTEAEGGQSGTPTGTVVKVSGNTYVVEGGGNGHQIGMSQYGAYAMAQEGFSYQEIVEFYYPGVRVDAL